MEEEQIKTTAELEPKKNQIDINKVILAGVILLAAIMISGALLFTNKAKTPSPEQAQIAGSRRVSVSVDDDPSIGDPKAKVTIIEFSDFQCPFCRSFWQNTLPQIKKEYIDTGKVRLVYRDFPLSIHPASHISAEAGNCANEQGKFWEYHDTIFAEQEKLGANTVSYGVSDLKKWAQEAGLDTEQFNACLDSGTYKGEVDKDLSDGMAAGVTGTPAFFINGRLVVGAQAFSVFQSVIEDELKQ